MSRTNRKNDSPKTPASNTFDHAPSLVHLHVAEQKNKRAEAANKKRANKKRKNSVRQEDSLMDPKTKSGTKHDPLTRRDFKRETGKERKTNKTERERVETEKTGRRGQNDSPGQEKKAITG